MASNVKKTKAEPTPKKDAAPKEKIASTPAASKTADAPKSADASKTADAPKTSDAPKTADAPKTTDAPNAEASEATGGAPKNYSRGEGQKPVTQAYKDNWNAIFGDKPKAKTKKKKR